MEGGRGELYSNLDKFVEVHANVRVRYRKGRDVDATGENFKDIREFKKLLLGEREQIARGLAGKLMTYATGRGMGFSDRGPIDGIVARAAGKGFGFRSLIHEVVQSELFRRDR